MGYTRYWKRTDKKITNDFCIEVREIISDCARKGIAIRNWDGDGRPEVELDCIAFNGNKKENLGHESFVLNNTQTGFDFCKTARKPYDYAVRKVLSAAKRYGLVIDVSSDGANNQVYTDEEYLQGLVKWK